MMSRAPTLTLWETLTSVDHQAAERLGDLYRGELERLKHETESTDYPALRSALEAAILAAPARELSLEEALIELWGQFGSECEHGRGASEDCEVCAVDNPYLNDVRARLRGMAASPFA